MTDDVERITLERLKVGVLGSVDFRDMEIDVKANVYRDARCDSLILSLTAYLASNKIHREVVSSRDVPRTWWDAFKLAWVPWWALRRWPATMDHIEESVQFIHVCPHISMSRGGDRMAHLMFMRPSETGAIR